MGQPLLKRTHRTLFAFRLQCLLTYALGDILYILNNDKIHNRKIFQLIVFLRIEITNTL